MNIENITNFVPEFRDIFIRRYEILEFLNKEGTLGRRTLSSKMDISERIIRDEISILRDMDCVDVSAAGISITKEGKIKLKDLSTIYRDLNNLTDLGKRIALMLNVNDVFVVKGDTKKSEHTYINLGAETARIIKNVVSRGDILGVTGGRTLSSIGDEMEKSKEDLDITVIPARGSLGRSAKFQANSIASKIATKLNGEYQLLPVPDTASAEAMKMLMENEEVKEAYNMLKSLDILVFGIGRADVMLDRRRISDDIKDEILDNKAVAEAFGHYFDIEGNEVYRSQSIGITIEDFKKIPRIIGVAGGCEKADSIISISSLRQDMILVIDESAANEILNIRRSI